MSAAAMMMAMDRTPSGGKRTPHAQDAGTGPQRASFAVEGMPHDDDRSPLTKAGRAPRRSCIRSALYVILFQLPFWSILGTAVSIAGLVIFPGYATRASHNARDALAFLGSDIGFLAYYVRVLVAVATSVVAVLFAVALAIGVATATAGRTRRRMAAAAAAAEVGPGAGGGSAAPSPAAAAAAMTVGGGQQHSSAADAAAAGGGRGRCAKWTFASASALAAAYAFLVVLFCVALLAVLVGCTVAAKIGEVAAEAASQGVRQAIALSNSVDPRLVNTVAGLAGSGARNAVAAAAAGFLPAGSSTSGGGGGGAPTATAAAAPNSSAPAAGGAAATGDPAAAAAGGGAAPAQAAVVVDRCPASSCFDAARFPFLRSKQCICDIALVRFYLTLRAVYDDGVRAAVGAALLVVGTLCIAMSVAANYVNVLWDMHAAPEFRAVNLD